LDKFRRAVEKVFKDEGVTIIKRRKKAKHPVYLIERAGKRATITVSVSPNDVDHQLKKLRSLINRNLNNVENHRNVQ
jgi:hypothetical protein